MNYAKHFSTCQNCIRCFQINRRECDILWRDKNYDLPCSDCFRKFTELDEEFIQPERSKREDDGRKCKHYGKFAILMPIESDSIENINQLRKTNDLKAFLKCHVLEEERLYDELDEKNKKIVDEMYAEQYSEFPSMRCSEHCGNTVREVQ